jgi:hypothetical protein
MKPLTGGNAAQRWFRIILWFVPSVIVVAWFLGFLWLTSHVRWLAPGNWWIAFAVAVLLIWGVGIFEGVLCGAPIATKRKGQTKELLLDALVFVLIQVLFIPTFLGVIGVVAGHLAILFGS